MASDTCDLWRMEHGQNVREVSLPRQTFRYHFDKNMVWTMPDVNLVAHSDPWQVDALVPWLQRQEFLREWIPLALSNVCLGFLIPAPSRTTRLKPCPLLWNFSLVNDAHLLRHKHLRTLHLEGFHLDDTQAIRLANMLPETQIRTLHLSHNDITNRGASAIFRALEHSCVTSLNMSCNQIGSEAVFVLCDTPHRLKHLNLSRNGIESDGIRRFASTLDQYSSLNLKSKTFFNCEFDIIMEDFLSPTRLLTVFDLSGEFCFVTHHGTTTKLLTDPLYFYDIWQHNDLNWMSRLPLTRLNLSGCRVHVSVLESLPRSLSVLCLANNRMGPEHAYVLARVLPQTQVCVLDLSRNRFGSGGWKALVNALPQLPSLNEFSFEDCDLTHADVQTLIRVLPLCPGLTIDS